MKEKIKINSLAKTLNVILVAVLCALGLAAAIGVVGLIVLLCLGGGTFADAQIKIELGELVLKLGVGAVSASEYRMFLMFKVARVIALLPFGALIVNGLRLISKNACAGKPFTQSSVKALKWSALGILILSVLPQLLGSLINLYAYNVADVGGLVGQGAVAKFSFGIPINFATLVLAAAVFLAAKIFERGKFLQKEYDATL